MLGRLYNWVTTSLKYENSGTSFFSNQCLLVLCPAFCIWVGRSGLFFFLASDQVDLFLKGERDMGDSDARPMHKTLAYLYYGYWRYGKVKILFPPGNMNDHTLVSG